MYLYTYLNIMMVISRKTIFLKLLWDKNLSYNLEIKNLNKIQFLPF